LLVRPHHRAPRAALGLFLGFVGLMTVGLIGPTAIGSAGVAAGSAAGSSPAAAPLPAHWVPFRHLPGVVDIAGPRGDGSFSVAAA
jgi:hypothetical protein